jgi:hypothetical protein
VLGKHRATLYKGLEYREFLVAMGVLETILQGTEEQLYLQSSSHATARHCSRRHITFQIMMGQRTERDCE